MILSRRKYKNQIESPRRLLEDSATMHIILENKIYFLNLTLAYNNLLIR